MNKFNFTFSGTSHTDEITMHVQNNVLGLKVCDDFIKTQIKARASSFSFNTSRIENDIYHITNVENGIITENEITISVKNQNVKSKDYLKGIIRPSHGDLVGYQVKGNDYDYAGGGVHSGRLTVLYVIFGAILEYNMQSVTVYPQIKQVLDIIDEELTIENAQGLAKTFPVVNEDVKHAMLEKISDAASDGNSLGAKLEFLIDGLDVGLGGLYFDSFESTLSRYLFGIGGIKSVEFGLGFDYVNHYGYDVTDELKTDGQTITSLTSMQGGLNAGYTNGLTPVKFSVVVRPTPTVLKELKTVKLNEYGSYQNIEYKYAGRHDSFFANRVIAVIKAVVYIALFEMEIYE